MAWFVKKSVFHSVNLAPSANGESNPAFGNNLYGRIYQIQVDNSSPPIYRQSPVKSPDIKTL